MIEMHCETDFVARTDQFRKGVAAILNSLHNDPNFSIDPSKVKDQEYIANQIYKHALDKSLDIDLPSQTIDDAIKYIISKT